MPQELIPFGTVTFLFTDIEGSTKLWELHPEAMRVSLSRHDALMRQAITASNGYVFKTMGDAFHAAFETAAEALEAALASQLAIASEPWPDETPIKVRMALHTGAVESRDNDYFGQPVNRVARLLSTAHGGQSLLSQTTYDLVRDNLPKDTSLRYLGQHRLKDLGRPEGVFQLLHPSLPAEFPPLRSLDNPELKHNLPQQVTSFVGRETQIAEVKGLLEKTRLLTLTGSGGSGKTRLALQVAADMLDDNGDGVWLVELASLTDPRLVPSTVSNVLGLTEEPGKPILHTLTEYLRTKQLVLILDNCEHLLTACASLADTLIRNCHWLLVLVTSREGLAISGETTYRIPSLSLPDPGHPQTAESLSHYESARLFIDRAKQVQTTFAVTDQNASALASICLRLDGIPLAIELAAARVRSLTVEDINGKLDQRFRLLTGGSRTALPRQQTLRSLIDWSYDLLSVAEKALLSRLSVFLGGWTLGEAEGVCAGEPVEEWETLDLLTSLCDKSLVVSETLGSTVRYRLLETVRQYARDRLLEGGEGEVWRNRHLANFTALAETAEPELRGPDQQVWLDRIETEHDNLRSALEWAAEGSGEASAAAEEGLRLAGALWRFWSVRGYFSEGRSRLSRALAGTQDRGARAKALNGAGVLAICQGDFVAAQALFEESLEIGREIGDRAGIAAALGNLGLVARQHGDYMAARTLCEESLTVRRQLGDLGGVAGSLINLGILAQEQGDYTASQLYHEEGLALARELGNRLFIANALNNLGSVAYCLGDYEASQALCEESLTIYRELGDRRGLAYALNTLGIVAWSQGEHARNQTLQRECLTVFLELGDRRGIASALEGLAATAKPVHAPHIWGRAERLREEIGSALPRNELPRYEKQVATTRAAFGDEPAFEAAWAEGRLMTLEQAMELAMEDPDV